MLATSVRVSPCRARSSPRSVGRVTLMTSSACSICIRAGTICESSPIGPLTCTRPGEIATVTPAGTSIGFLPMRLIGSLPDEADHFAADTLLLGGATRDHAPGGGKDSGPHSAQNARQTVLARVDAAARLRDALQVGDDALAVAAELELDHERVEALALVDVEIGDVALLLQEPCDLLLEARGRHRRRRVHRLVGVADAREHVGNRVGHHGSALPARLRHAGDDALVGELAQADPAQPELLEDGARAAAAVAAAVRARLEPLGPCCLDDERLLCHEL